MFVDDRNRITDLNCTLTENATGNRDAFFSRVMCNAKNTLCSITMTILFIHAVWIFVAFQAEVCVGPAPELGNVTAEVALKLDVTKTMLLTHELLLNAHI
mgnify:FL=1